MRIGAGYYTDIITSFHEGLEYSLKKCLGVFMEILGELWHNGNDGTDSGLDADMVDGVHASSFLRSDADDTLQVSFLVGNTANRSAGMYGTYDAS